MFVDRLADAIREKGSPICAGIDPSLDLLPEAVAGDPRSRNANDLDASLDAVHDFCHGILEAVAPIVPIVKFQSAYFERFLWEGVETYYELVQEAKDLGLLVIGDVKRGDIGATSEAYAAAHLIDAPFEQTEHVSTPDAITINPMLGLDSIEPFLAAATESGKGLFILVRTSNPGSADLQDVKLADQRTWSEALADRVAEIAARPRFIGSNGLSSIGAVVGATQPHTLESLRSRLPRSVFLLPGYGAQGATAEMTRRAFMKEDGSIDPTRALVSASRSILYAYRDKAHAGKDWKQAATDAVVLMHGDLDRILK